MTVTSPPPTAARPLVLRFPDVGLEDVDLVGGKGANLGELTRAGFPVPGGFVVSAEAFLATLEMTGQRDSLRALVDAVDPDDPEALDAASEEAVGRVRAATLPDELRSDVVAALGELRAEAGVAVRSSATLEDTAGASFAGMNRTFTNVHGADEVLARLTDCWASLYAPRVLAYRRSRRIDVEPPRPTSPRGCGSGCWTTPRRRPGSGWSPRPWAPRSRPNGG